MEIYTRHITTPYPVICGVVVRRVDLPPRLYGFTSVRAAQWFVEEMKKSPHLKILQLQWAKLKQCVPVQ